MDIRRSTSKVKPRLVPSFGSSSSAGEIPPPTPVSTLQEIGVNCCAIPESELSYEALLAAPSSAPEPDAVRGDLASSTSE